MRQSDPIAGPWDLVLFSGDLVQKGTEYAQLETIFGKIWDCFRQLGCDPKLLAVPGNHDLPSPYGTEPPGGFLMQYRCVRVRRNRAGPATAGEAISCSLSRRLTARTLNWRPGSITVVTESRLKK